MCFNIFIDFTNFLTYNTPRQILLDNLQNTFYKTLQKQKTKETLGRGG